MFSEGGTVLKEKYANAEDQTGLPSGAGEGEGVRQGSEHEARNRDREVFEDDGQLDSAEAQSADALMEMNAILAEGNFDDLSDEDLAKIKNPALRAQLQGKALEAKQAAELKAHQEMWDRQMHRIGDVEYSGAQLHSMHEYLKDDQNADAFEKELMAREGISREEAKKRRANLQEYLALKEKERNGEKLTPEEKYQLQNPTTEVAADTKKLENRVEGGRRVELGGSRIEQNNATQEESVSSRRMEFRDPSSSLNAKSLFASSTPSEIKTDVKLTGEYNAKANVVEIEKQRPEIKRDAVATVEPTGSMGFG